MKHICELIALTLIIFIQVVLSAEDVVVPVFCQKIRSVEGYTFSVEGRIKLDKDHLISEDWTDEGTVIAFIEYDTPSSGSDETVVSVSTGKIITNSCKSINYTATFKEGFKKMEIKLYYLVKDDPEDTGHNNWIIGLAVSVLIICILGFLGYLCLKKTGCRNPGGVNAVLPGEAENLSIQLM